MSRIRTSATEVTRFLDSGATPLYVLDEDRQIVFCNSACAAWVGLKVSQLLGQTCRYHAPNQAEPAANVAAGLCPPPQAFAGATQRAVVSCLAADGRLVFRRGTFLPLADGLNESAPVLAVLETADCPADAFASDESAAELRDRDLHEQVRRFRQSMTRRFAPDRLIGNHPLVVRARTQIELAAQSGANVLIVGPPGSGRQHAAKAIHYSQTEPGLLVPLDCAVLETNVLRSALRSMAARNAAQRTVGQTIVFSDMDNMSTEAQEDLLAFLRAGALRSRVVATTTCTLEELSADPLFSHDLACQLATVVIELPALASRLQDLPLLAQALVEEVNASGVRQLAGFTSEALDQLAAYPWPGNLDELARVVRETHERAQGVEIAAGDLPKQMHWGADATAHPRVPDEAIVLEAFLARVERELITRAMRRSKGNKSKAAKLLGLTRPRLYRRLVQLGLEQADGKRAE